MRVLIRGPFFQPLGYSEVARGIALGLSDNGVDVFIENQRWGNVPDEVRDDDMARLATMAAGLPRGLSGGFDATITVGVADFFPKKGSALNIGVTMLECDRIPPYWVWRCNQLDEVWVPTEFNRKTFAWSGVNPKKIRVMPFGLDMRRYHPGLKPLNIPGRRGYAFLSVFEWIPRKGYDILLEAFFEEFGANEDVSLILKVQNNSRYDPQGLEIRRDVDNIARRVGRINHPPVILLTETIPQEQMPNLYASADSFVLPTRGEGWSLVAMEAMACGLPTIITSWSGPTQFLNERNGYPLRIKGLVPVPRSGTIHDAIYENAKWAEPDKEHLKKLMRHLFTHRDEARAKGHYAAEDIRLRFNRERWISGIFRRLKELVGNSKGIKERQRLLKLDKISFLYPHKLLTKRSTAKGCYRSTEYSWREGKYS